MKTSLYALAVLATLGLAAPAFAAPGLPNAVEAPDTLIQVRGGHHHHGHHHHGMRRGHHHHGHHHHGRRGHHHH